MKYPIYRSTSISLYKQKGVGLIEVLVAIILLSSVLMGAIALQLSTAKEQRSAQFVSRAVLLASEMGERIRANRDAIRSSITSTNPINDYLYLTNSEQIAVKSAMDANTTVQCTQNCSSISATAKNDMITWWQTIRTQMPPDSVGMLLMPNTTTINSQINALSRDIVIVWREPVVNKSKNNTAILLNNKNNSCPASINASEGMRCYVQRVML